MIRQRDIRQFDARYHRNGICGTGFYLCSFKFLRGLEAVGMRAVVFPDPGNVAVMSDNISVRWRGDDFEAVLREAIAMVERNRPEALHLQGSADA